MADPGRARYSQVQCQKDPSCAIFSKSRRFEDIKYDTERYVWGINWGIIWGISRASFDGMSGGSLRCQQGYMHL